MQKLDMAALYDTIRAFLDKTPAPEVEGKNPLWIEDVNNLWFQGIERKNPALLAVRIPDGTICYRDSNTEFAIHATGVPEVSRGRLKNMLGFYAEERRLKILPVYQLTKQKAREEAFVKSMESIDFSEGI